MAVMQPPVQPASAPRPIWKATLGAFALALVALVAIVLLVAAIGALAGEPELSTDVLTLALPALLDECLRLVDLIVQGVHAKKILGR